MSRASGWSVTKLVAASTLGVLYLVLALAGATIPAITGIPMSGGLVNFVVSAAMYTLGCLVVRQFGTATLMGFIYSVLALPLPLYGAPGFAPKIIIGLLTGLVADCAFHVLRQRPVFASFAVGGSTQVTITLLVAGLGVMFQMPGIEKMIALFLHPVSLALMLVLGGAAGLLGFWLYTRIENRAVIHRIQASRPVPAGKRRPEPGSQPEV